MNAQRIGPLVGDVMTEEPVVVHQDVGLPDAAHLMDVHHVSGLPVVDGQGTLVGVLSQTDLIRARTTESLWTKWPGLRVRHLMTAPALTVGVEASLVEAARAMERNHVHRLVVTGADGQVPVGILSMSDLVRLMGELR